ncbi:Benzoate transporter [Acididesulfobacillus acetoxydans]|uniref:Benzoate membrane transport protein n=1 Tax=Acididesulfobacillus acetoxydans TaxID=1561005 RepID=A0A8S0XB89_9FIRM|nr:benzoate/H(+) symporter BenE family transporter [Acididesulfobacillus acetoxydans]CAA7600926.1 Benzoate transporter [Acididesulfobacillus acetoxydans]CEJ08917.1 Benzoate membrane transport protein [Acididesulfobacillus acetoxydans]
MLIEKGYNLGGSLKILGKNISAAPIATGFVAMLFSTMGPGMIVMNAAKQGGLSDAQAVSWLLAIYVFGGLSTMFMALRYRIPSVVAFSIPGAVMLGKMIPHFAFNQVIGAYIVVALVAMILTLTGVIKKVVEHIPVPIMLGMVGGVLLSFGTNMLTATLQTPQIYGVMLAAFFLVMTFRSFSQKVPPIIVAIVVGVIMLIFYKDIKPVPFTWEIASPVFVAPAFSLRAILDISVPLFFLVIGVQNIQAVGVLMAENYEPPINAMYLVPSIVSVINSVFGGHSAVHAGPSTAICSSSAAGEKKEYRFIAAFFEGVFWFVFGLLAKVVVESVKMVPPQFTAVLAGLAMFEVFASAFKGAFNGKFRYGALVAFFVAITNLTVLNIGAPLWSIILGVVTSLLAERGDFNFSKPPVSTGEAA